MFTGIIEEIGTITGVSKGRNSAILTVSANKVLTGTQIGDSIAVNGVCLTVTDIRNNCFTADVMHETLNRSSLSQAEKGSRVNLERAMSADGRFGGHIVSGHIDGTGTVIDIRQDDNAIWFTIAAEPKIMRYVIEKGSVTIDGISLTVAKLGNADFAISAIPHTVAQTILQYKKKGDTVNLENDIIGKYVERLLTPGQSARGSESGITREFLQKYGF